MKSFAVIGLGRFGSSVAKTLYRMGYDVLAVDSCEERVNEIADDVTHAVQADAKDEEALKALGIRNFDVVIVAIGMDTQSSILVTVILKELGVKRVVAKAQNELQGKVLAKVGADQVVFPERDMGVRVANNLASSSVLDYIELSPTHNIMELRAPHQFVGKSLGGLNLRAKYGITVIAVKVGDEVHASPGADTVINEGDIMVVVGSNTSIKKLEGLE